MLILIEGVDGSGKTTLCKQLKEKGLKIKTSPRRDDLYCYYDWLKLAASNELFVVDRSFVTELVYRIVDGKEKGTMNLKDMCDVLPFCKIILCETNSAFEDSMIRGEDNITSKTISMKIQLVYQIITTMLSKFASTKTFTYDWKHQNVNDVLKFIYQEV